MKACLDALVSKELRNNEELSPAMMDFFERDRAGQKALLHEWRQHVVQQRARDDAEIAVHGFIAICVLAVIAAGFLVAL